MPGLTSPQNYPYPLYTEANNFPAQFQAFADAVDDSIVAAQTTIAAALARKQASASAVVNQSIPNAVLTTLTYTTEDSDTDNMINLGVSNTLVTVQTAGHYLVIGEVEYASNATGERSLRVSWSGGPGGLNKTVGAVNGAVTRLIIAEHINATVGQTFVLNTLQNSGGALNSTFRRIQAIRISG